MKLPIALIFSAILLNGCYFVMAPIEDAIHEKLMAEEKQRVINLKKIEEERNKAQAEEERQRKEKYRIEEEKTIADLWSKANKLKGKPEQIKYIEELARFHYDAEACYRMSVAYRQGRVVERDLSSSLSYLDIAVSKMHPKALYERALISLDLAEQGVDTIGNYCLAGKCALSALARGQKRANDILKKIDRYIGKKRYSEREIQLIEQLKGCIDLQYSFDEETKKLKQ